MDKVFYLKNLPSGETQNYFFPLCFWARPEGAQNLHLALTQKSLWEAQDRI